MPEPAVRASKLTIMLAVAAALATGASACGDDTGDLPPPASPPASSSEPSPGLDLTPAEQQAVDEARAKFDEFMNAYLEVSTADVPTPEEAEDLFAEVDQHIGGGELSQELRMEIIGRWGEQQTLSGTAEWTFDSVVTVDLDREVEGRSSPQVDLQYCIDMTALTPVDARTRQPSGELGDRQLWNAAVVWSDDWFGQDIEGWRIRTRDPLEDPC